MQKLIADQLNEDSRLVAAKKTLLDIIAEYRAKITHICPAQKEHVLSYETLLASFVNYRGAPLWYPYVGSGLGNGALVELADGSVKYDFISGIGVHFGHSHPIIQKALVDAACQNTVMQGPLQQNRESVALSKVLVKTSGLDHAFLTSSGVMANENGLKMIFQKKHPRSRILAFEDGFMGRTLTVAQITDKPFFRDGLPLNLLVDYIPFTPDHPEHALGVLKRLLQRYPTQYACMCFELIQGEAGFRPGNTQFFATLMKELKAHDIAILVDEIQTFGRTDHLFAFQHFKLEKYVDVVTIGKLFQTCATLFTKEFKPRPGLIAQTYTASTAMLMSSLALIQNLQDDSFLGPNGKNTQYGDYFRTRLEEIEKRNPELASGPFGYKAMVAFTPFKGKRERVVAFLRRLFDNGVIAFMAGTELTRCRFHMPLGSVTQNDIDNVVSIVEKTLQE